MLKQLRSAAALAAAPCPRRDRGGLRRFFVLVQATSSEVLGPAANYDYQNFTYSQGLTGDGHWKGCVALDYVTLPEDYAAIPLKQADIEPSEEDPDPVG